MRVTDPGVQIYARQLGVSPEWALRRLQFQQIGRETKDYYDSTMLPELSPYATRMLGLHLAMDQADRIPGASPVLRKEREDRFAELREQADSLTEKIISTHGIAGLRKVAGEVREHEERRAGMKGAA